MTDPNAMLVERAEALARAVHATDTDKLGVPYVEHLRAVAEGVADEGGPLEAIAAAWLHDAIEDHPEHVSAATLAAAGFPGTVIDTVLAVTRRPGETQAAYLDRIRAAGPLAVAVKLADLRHNGDPARLARLPAATRERLTAKYAAALAYLR